MCILTVSSRWCLGIWQGRVTVSSEWCSEDTVRACFHLLDTVKKHMAMVIFWVSHVTCFAISLGCYRIQKPLKSGNTKKIFKKYKITHFRFGPKNTKKLPKNYKNGHFLANFVIFRSFFRIFGAKPEMGDFVSFLYFFRISRLEGFLYSVAPQGDRNVTCF